jgi:hypothetical protein
VILVLCVSGVAAAGSEEAIRPNEPIQLFNGVNLDGFYTWLVDDHREDPAKVFSVVDQIDGGPAIRVSGQKWGGFVTMERYRDYHLVVEFRWGLATWGNRKNSARDSGILLHCTGDNGNTREDFNGPWMKSIETQIIEGGVADFIVVAGFDKDGNRTFPGFSALVSQDKDGEDFFDPAGTRKRFERGRVNWTGRDPDWKGELGFRGKNDVESPFGEWTRLEVICDGNTITNIVNGKVVNQATDTTVSDGKIMIQSEGAEVYFRKIDLLPLE